MKVRTTKTFEAVLYTGNNINEILSFVQGWENDDVVMIKSISTKQNSVAIMFSNFILYMGSYILRDEIDGRLWVETKEEFSKYYEEISNG